MQNGRPVFLVGFMGSGKTTVGRELARRLGDPFLDTDEEVERRAGRSIADIFRESGEGRFRTLEWQVLQEVDRGRRSIVATGGGLFLGTEPRRLMRAAGCTVWLDVPLDECRRRLGTSAVRPLWRPHDPLSLRAFFERRRAIYALADLRVAAGPAPPAAVVELLIDRLARLPLIFLGKR